MMSIKLEMHFVILLTLKLTLPKFQLHAKGLNGHWSFFSFDKSYIFTDGSQNGEWFLFSKLHCYL